MTTFRAAYITADKAGNGAGFLLAPDYYNNRPDDVLMADALEAVKTYNDNIACIASITGDKPARAEDIVIGEWTE